MLAFPVLIMKRTLGSNRAANVGSVDDELKRSAIDFTAVSSLLSFSFSSVCSFFFFIIFLSPSSLFSFFSFFAIFSFAMKFEKFASDDRWIEIIGWKITASLCHLDQ